MNAASAEMLPSGWGDTYGQFLPGQPPLYPPFPGGGPIVIVIQGVSVVGRVLEKRRWLRARTLAKSAAGCGSCAPAATSAASRKRTPGALRR